MAHLVPSTRSFKQSKSKLRTQYEPARFAGCLKHTGYDVFGNRAEKIVDADGAGAGSAVTSKFAYDMWKASSAYLVGNENNDVLFDLNGDNTLKTRYLRTDAIDQVFARIDYTSSTSTAFWYLEDSQNSIRGITNASGTVVGTVQYDAFGNILSDSSYRGRYGWTGREYDVEVGLQYNRARYYDAGTGRWMSQDPMGFDAGDSNLYRYVSNKPIIGSDPSGLEWPWNWGWRDLPLVDIPFHVYYAPVRVAAWWEGRKLDEKLEAMRERVEVDVLKNAMTSKSQHLGGMRNDVYDPNWNSRIETTIGDSRMMATVGVMWLSMGSTWVSGSQFVFNMNSGRWMNVSANRAATSAEAEAAQDAAMAGLSGSRSRGVWDLGWAARGPAIEQRLGGNLPNGFITIDRFSNGVATSIKSIDMLGTDGSAQLASYITSQGRTWIDSVAGFTGGTRAGTTIQASQVTSRALDLAISPGETALQRQALDGLISYGAQKHVAVNIIVIRH